ncbi:MAG TPA: haloacid dehalogenase-like hydrolase [Candidatus Methylomirabilis sp.]|jgi:FMN phosphatase YigB (HAD superfamily)
MGPSEAPLLLDFDHTLFDTDRFFWVDVRAAVARLGVDPRLWEETYEAVWPGGYSIERHVEALAARASWPHPQQLLEAFDEQFADLRRYLFPDVLPFLQAARRAGRRVVLVSFGDPAWQTFKVKESGLTTLLDEVHTAGVVGGKAGLAAALVGMGPEAAEAIAIDNNPLELDAMRDRCPALRTYRMDRVPPDLADVHGEAAYRFREARTYVGLPARHPHRACRGLGEVAL